MLVKRQLFSITLIVYVRNVVDSNLGKHQGIRRQASGPAMFAVVDDIVAKAQPQRKQIEQFIKQQLRGVTDEQLMAIHDGSEQFHAGAAMIEITIMKCVIKV